MSRKTVNNIRLIASETGVEVLDDIWTGKEISQTRFGSSKELEWLERNLFRYPYKTMEKNVKYQILVVMYSNMLRMRLILWYRK